MFTQIMIQRLHETPMTHATATEFARVHGVPLRAVITRVKSLGLQYTPKAAVTKILGSRPRKADVVLAISMMIDVPCEAISGIERADYESLDALLTAVRLTCEG